MHAVGGLGSRASQLSGLRRRRGAQHLQSNYSSVITLYMPSRSIAIDQLLASFGKSARGSHQARLDAQTLAALERFVTYLVKVEGKG